MLTADDVRAIALALPEAAERDHHGRPSFRVGGRIFATLWTPQALNVFVEPGEAGATVQTHPESCSELHWGGARRGVRLDLGRASPELAAELLAAAWARRAPARLIRAYRRS
jgi:hypothetical protein